MNLGMPEMIFIFLVALVVFGPRKLPELGRQLGKALAEFKRASNEFKNQLEAEMLNIELEERARKQEQEAKLLPPEPSYQPPVASPAGSISRGSTDALNEPLVPSPSAYAGPEQPASTPQPEHNA